MARRLVLVMALLAAVGFGFGWITEDLCCLGGSYADDPNTPLAAAEFALPAHFQAASKAALPAIAVGSGVVRPFPIGAPSVAPEGGPVAISSLQNPRRC